MIRLAGITLRRGPEPLLEGAGATIHRGRKIGLVGANGSGKSSLFALLRGELHADRGDVVMPAGWRIAHMAQETAASDRAALDFVLDGDSELRAAERGIADAEAAGSGDAIARAHARLDSAGGYTARARAGALLAGLGFGSDTHTRPVAAFSGGWRVRLNLARALMCPSDLLLLDEPSNHLDLEAVLWLEQWLRAYPGTLLLIAHDREFLDNVVDAVLHIEHRRLTLYRGGYSAFEHQRAAQLAQQQALYDKQQREIAHLQRFIDRFRAKATKARAAQSRIKTLERMERLAPAHVDSPFRFRFPPPPRPADPLLSLDDVALGYGDQPVLDGLRLGLRRGDRIGLLGPNGAGKSTLVRALAGALAPSAGRLTRGRNVRTGYFAQHQLERIDPAASVLLHLRRLAPKLPEQRLREFVGGFGFHGDQATAAVAPLSGGEKARLALALLVWQAPNLLLLDEPTNHLDLEMRHALTLALQEFEGAVVVVSHDRHLLNATVERYWLVDDGTAGAFDGDLDDYRDWLAGRRRNDGGAAEPGIVDDRSHSATARKVERQRAAARRRTLAPLRQRVERLLGEMETLDAELAGIERLLGDAALYEADGRERLTTLLQRQGALRGRYRELEHEWAAAEEALEAAREQG